MNETLVVIVRGMISFFTLLIFARFLGKSQISQLTYFDYIVGISIGNIAGSLTTDLSSRPWINWVGLFTWTGLAFVLQWISKESHYIAKYVEGEPTVVIMNGKIMENAMRKMRYRMSDLMMLMREKNVFDIREVEFAVLESDGHLSVLKKNEYQTVTLKDLNLPAKYKGISTELIYDGTVFEQNLKQVHLDRDWLAQKLQSLNIKDPSEVFLATLDTQGNLYIDLYKDQIRDVVDIGDFRGPN